VLQHPQAYARSLDAAWTALYRIFVFGERPVTVFTVLRTHGSDVEDASKVPTRPSHSVARPTVTIADLDDFAADAYAEQLDAWCCASLVSWGVTISAPAPTAQPNGERSNRPS
jgi:hypothetical protein